MHDLFRRFAHRTSIILGTPWVFTAAVLLILLWGLSGPFFRFSNSWQLVINTATTVVTFLMVFLIQNTQNRDAKAIHLKLDELIRAIRGARMGLIDLEELDDKALEQLTEQFRHLRERRQQAAAHQTRGHKGPGGRKPLT